MPAAPRHAIARIVSGGQSGVDRAALDFAVARDIAYGGWVPRGGRSEDLADPPGVLGRFPELKETPTSDTSERTEWNVRDSDATLIVRPVDVVSPGTDATEAAAARLGRPHLVTDGSSPNEVAAWLLGLGNDITLNIAGPRASEWTEGFDVTTMLLTHVLAADPSQD